MMVNKYISIVLEDGNRMDERRLILTIAVSAWAFTMGFIIGLIL